MGKGAAAGVDSLWRGPCVMEAKEHTNSRAVGVPFVTGADCFTAVITVAGALLPLDGEGTIWALSASFA